MGAAEVRVRPARPEDLRALMGMYAQAIELMAGTEQDVGWRMGVHPSRGQLARAIERAELLVAELAGDADAGEGCAADAGGSGAGVDAGGGAGACTCEGSAPSTPCGAGGEAPRASRIVGALVVDSEQARGYEHVVWGVDAPPGQIAVVHLFVVAPQARGRGAARTLLDAAAALAEARGCAALRLDVFANATHAIEVYRACGFADLGLHELHYPDCENTAFRLFERDLR